MTYPYIAALADFGLEEACRKQEGLAQGINVMEGKLTCPAVAEAHGMPCAPLPFETKK